MKRNPKEKNTEKRREHRLSAEYLTSTIAIPVQDFGSLLNIASHYCLVHKNYPPYPTLTSSHTPKLHCTDLNLLQPTNVSMQTRSACGLPSLHTGYKFP